MRHAVGVLALAALGPSPAYGQDQIGEYCSGTETIVVGADAPRVVPYSLTFSADTVSGYYCYAECRPEQTYAIRDRRSRPLKLADVRGADQTRLMTFDRETAILTDYQVIRLLGTTTRSATATCRAAPFHRPTPHGG